MPNNREICVSYYSLANIDNVVAVAVIVVVAVAVAVIEVVAVAIASSVANHRAEL